MKKPDELAANTLYSEREHKRRSTTLRRLAGGIRAHASADAFEGFNDAERKVLASAAALLDAAAEASKKAAVVARKRLEEREGREAAMLSEMAATFGQLRSVEDQVALIAASHERYQLEEVLKSHPDHLGRVFQEGLRAVASALARTEVSLSPGVAVAAAWSKFVSTKEGLVARHRPVVEALAVEAEGKRVAEGASERMRSAK